MAGLATGIHRSRLVEADEAANDDSEVVTLADLMAVLPGATAAVAEAVQNALFDLVSPVRAPDQSGVRGRIDH